MLPQENRIDSIESLRRWIEQDRVSLGYKTKRSIIEVLIGLIAPNYIVRFERRLRICEYLTNTKSGCLWEGLLLLERLKLRRLQVKLGFSIPLNVFGPGLSIAHYGTLVVSPHASIGANCRIHVGVNIGASGGLDLAPHIGDNVYIGPGSILFGDISIANNVYVGANATVNKSFFDENVVIAGTPAKIVKTNTKPWNNRVLDE